MKLKSYKLYQEETYRKRCINLNREKCGREHPPAIPDMNKEDTKI